MLALLEKLSQSQIMGIAAIFLYGSIFICGMVVYFILKLYCKESGMIEKIEKLLFNGGFLPAICQVAIVILGMTAAWLFFAFNHDTVIKNMKNNSLVESVFIDDYTRVTPFQSASDQTVRNVLKRLSGDWYDSNKKLVVIINQSSLNDDCVVGGFGFKGGEPGSGYLIIEKNGVRKTILLEWATVESSASSVNKIMTVNDGITLYRRKI